jgi:ubiquinone biosynthesis protein UbiJ
MKPRLLLVGSRVAIASASWAGQMDEDRNPDPPLSTEQLQLVAKLSAVEVERIDRALLENCSRGWRKVARVVGTTMMDLKPRPPGIPDLYYSQRITKLVEEGKLESAGNLQFMRYSEVRLREQ